MRARLHQIARLMGHLGAALLALAPVAAHAEWREAETAHFILYSDDSEQDLIKLAERLEGIDGLLRMATGIADSVEPVKVRIYAVRSTTEVDRALGLSGSGVAGFYDSNMLGPFAVTPRKTPQGSGAFTPELVLHHEYAHHFMLQYFPSIYPQWYVEGFAELIGSSKFLPDGRIGYGMPAKHRGDHLGFYWAPLQEVLVKPANKVHNFDLYGQGWALTHYLTFDKERAPQLRQYLQALRGGAKPEEAVKAFGNLVRLNQDAAKYLRAGSFEYRPVAIPIEKPVVRKMRLLSSGEAALIPEVIAFRDEDLDTYRKAGARDREARLRAANLERIREKAQLFLNDPFALYLLAEAEYASANYDQSAAAADRLLSIQPNHVRGNVRKALNMLQKGRSLQGAARAANAAEARRLVIKANRADPNDVLPLVAFYQSFHLAGQQAPKAAVDGLISAVETVPSDTAIRQLLVDEFAAQKKWAEAIAYLRPIANSPHGSPRRDAALKQMEFFEAELAKQGG